MNKQSDNKVIEEMANIINEMPERNAHYYVKENGRAVQKEAFADCTAIATALVNAGYCKVNDDDVVLSKEEYKKLKKYKQDWLNDEKMHLQAELEETEFELACANRLLEQTRKETAREILQKIAYESEYAYCNRDTKWFERICKEYDIDINLFY